MCSRSRAFKIRQRMTELLKASELLPGEGFKMLTLTIKSQPDLLEMCKQMQTSFRKLRFRKFWKRVFRGGCFIQEITGSEGKWHAHLHIILQGQYCPQALILKHWRAINSTGGVYITKCDKRGVLFYLTKYLTKEADYKDDCQKISDVLKGYRLFQPFGIWHNLLPPFRKKQMPCPHCGCKIWVPEHVIFSYTRDKDYQPKSSCMFKKLAAP